MTARSLLLLSVSVLSSCGGDGPSSENPWRSQRAEFLEIAEGLERSRNDWIGLSAAERVRAQHAGPGV
jgi:hypothetical protein